MCLDPAQFRYSLVWAVARIYPYLEIYGIWWVYWHRTLIRIGAFPGVSGNPETGAWWTFLYYSRPFYCCAVIGLFWWAKVLSSPNPQQLPLNFLIWRVNDDNGDLLIMGFLPILGILDTSGIYETLQWEHTFWEHTLNWVLSISYMRAHRVVFEHLSCALCLLWFSSSSTFRIHFFLVFIAASIPLACLPPKKFLWFYFLRIVFYRVFVLRVPLFEYFTGLRNSMNDYLR